jgi:hypothetical protein
VAPAAAPLQLLVRRVAATQQFQHAFQHLQHLQQMIEPLDLFYQAFIRFLSLFLTMFYHVFNNLLS